MSDSEAQQSSAATRRKPLWRRLLKWMLATTGVLLLVFVVLAAWVVGTRSGLDFAWSLIGPRLSDTMAAAKVEGRLIGPLTISGVELDTDTAHITVQRIHLEWRASDLLSATVNVQKLTVEGVRYVGKNAPEPPDAGDNEPFALPDAIQLPLALQVDELDVDDVSIVSGSGAKPLKLTQARARGVHLGSRHWRIGSLTAHGPLFDINAEAQLAPGGRYATTLSLDAKLRPAQLAPIKATINASGDVDRLQVSADVAAPYNATLDGRITNIALDALGQIGVDATLALDHVRLQTIRDDLPPVAPITTKLHVSGTPAHLTVAQSVAAPYNAQLKATLRDVLETPRIKGHLKLTDTKLGAIKKDLPPVALDTTVAVSGTPKNIAVQLDASADSARFGVVNTAARLHYSPEAVTIKKLVVKRPGTPMQLTANGTVALARGHAMDLRLEWQSLRWPLLGDATYLSKQGLFSLTGVLDDYDIQGHMRWQVAGQAAGKLDMAGAGDLKSFQLKQLRISGAPGDIGAHAKVVWAPKLAVQAHVEGTHINPGAVAPKMPGDFSLTADVRAKQRADGAIVAHVDTLTADGMLRGQPLALDANLAYLGDRVKIDKLALDYGQTSVQASGSAGWTPNAALNLTWAIESDDLSGLWPTLVGTLATKGHVEGTVSAPSADATLSARGIEYTNYKIASVDLDADVDWSGATQSQLSLDVAGIQAAGQNVKSLSLDLSGTPSAHTLALDLDNDKAQLAATLNGGLDKQRMVWNFTLTELKAAYGKLAPWALAAPASGQLSADAQGITDACLTSGAARLCVTGHHDGKGSTASLQLADLAFGYAKPFLPDNLEVSGALSGKVQAQLPAGGKPQATVHLETTDGKVVAIQTDGNRVKVLAFDPARIDASLADKTGLDVQLELPLHDAGSINARVAVAPGNDALTARPLTGAMHLDVTKLDFVTRMVSQITEINGRITGDMQISGTLSQPRVLGDVALNAERLVLLSPGLVITDMQLTASGHGNDVDLSMTAHSGGGDLAVDGKVNFNDAGPNIDLSITGDGFQIANTPMVRAWISPDLDVAVTPDAVRATGVLTVPKARITPRNLPAAGVQTVSGDAVIVDQKQSTAETAARAIHADIKVVLGDVRFKGFGLKTGINGTLRVQQVPGEPVTGAGELTLVNGSYRAYGQNLDIQNGKIYFSGGPITNPGVRLRAARYPAEDVTVGVQVTGSVEQPKVTLFSEPAMSQAETLSWLLLGRPLEGTTGGQGNLIAKAVLALGSGRGNKVLDNVGDALGLDNIGIGSAAGHGAGEAAFMVGKYLTPRLYISYGVGIFSSVSTLGLRYTLNSHWQLKSESSDVGTGADIIYTFDR